MSMKSLAGFAGLAAVAALGACASEEPQAVVVTPTPAAATCTPMAGQYVKVVNLRPVYYTGTFEPGYVAVTDTSAIGQGNPNATEYVVVTDSGQQLPLITRETYRAGEQLYVVPDSCNRAQVTVIQELG